MHTNISKDELLEMILEQKARLDRLEGRQRGPITMREARLANERGDK